MTEAMYLADSTVREFTATVTDVDGERVVLDRTHFYPTGGGQPHDTGMLEFDDEVADVVEVTGRGDIQHHLDGPVPDEGTTVTGHVDWDRRAGHMRHHTAQHLLSAVLLDEFDAETTGNQVYADRARIDVAYPRFDESTLQQIEDAVNEYIDADIPVETYTLDRETAEAELDPERTRLDMLPSSVTEVRIVEIGDVDQTACAGTHVQRTGDLGEFVVTGRETKGSDEERVRFELT